MKSMLLATLVAVLSFCSLPAYSQESTTTVPPAPDEGLVAKPISEPCTLTIIEESADDEGGIMEGAKKLIAGAKAGFSDWKERVSSEMASGQETTPPAE